MDDLKFTKEIIKKSGYVEESICLENLVKWEDMCHANSLADGPGRIYHKYKFAWLDFLRIFIEV